MYGVYCILCFISFRKPKRTIHIDPHGSASLITTSKDVRPVSKQVLQCSQRVKESINNLDKQLKGFSEDLPSRTKQPASLSHYNMFGENGMLSMRTCKSTEDRLPPVDGGSGVHRVDIFCPKTPQKLYFTPVENPVVLDSDDSTSASTSSSDGFLPNSSTTTGTIRSSSRNKPVTIVSPHSAEQDSTNDKLVTVVILPDLIDQNEPLQNIENPKVADTVLNESSNATSRSCSPLTIKDPSQHKPLNNFSLKVVKLSQSMLGGSNVTNIHQNSSADANDKEKKENSSVDANDKENSSADASGKDRKENSLADANDEEENSANDEEKKASPAKILFEVDHTAEAAAAHHCTNSLRNTTSSSRTDVVNAITTGNAEIDMQNSDSVATMSDCNGSPSILDSRIVVPAHVRSSQGQDKPTSTNSHVTSSNGLKDFDSKSCNKSSSSSVNQKSTKHKEFKSQEFITSSSSEQEHTPTNVKSHEVNCGTGAVSEQKAVNSKLGNSGKESNAFSPKSVENKGPDSHLSSIAKILSDENHSSPLLKRRLYLSDKENSNDQRTGVNDKSNSKPKLRNKGIYMYDC